MGKSKKVIVKIHIPAEKFRGSVNFLETPLKQSGIKYIVYVDRPKKNRKYPYLTVNEQILCMKRTLSAARGRT